MIITCPNCKKKFNIDPTLIPEEGRDLKCGLCEHVWHYKAEDEIEDTLTLNENISKSKVELDTETKVKNLKFSKKLQQEKTIKPEIKKKISKEVPETITKSENNGPKFFSYLIVFIISLVVLIIFIDTLKIPLINVLPGLEIILFNLFETLQDIKLFIIDLI